MDTHVGSIQDFGSDLALSRQPLHKYFLKNVCNMNRIVGEMFLCVFCSSNKDQCIFGAIPDAPLITQRYANSSFNIILCEISPVIFWRFLDEGTIWFFITKLAKILRGSQILHLMAQATSYREINVKMVYLCKPIGMKYKDLNEIMIILGFCA